jgi:hypothetical protein
MPYRRASFTAFCRISATRAWFFAPNRSFLHAEHELHHRVRIFLEIPVRTVAMPMTGHCSLVFVRSAEDA